MNYTVRTDYKPCTLRVQVRSLNGMRLRMQVLDPGLVNTYLADRVIETRGGARHTCYVPMPLCGSTTLIRITDSMAPNGSDNLVGVEIGEITVMGLQTYQDAINWLNGEVGQAISLGRRFCYNAGWLPVTADGRAYCSGDGSLKLKYLDTLIDPKSKAESITPMRIHPVTKIMEASRKLCVPFTVPGRAVMFFHEFSHEFENTRPDWELEADLNGLTIYLGLGFSRYEAMQVYRDVLYSAPSPENQERMVHIEKFINNFETYIVKP